MASPVSVTTIDRVIWRVTFGDATGNILHAQTIEALTETFQAALKDKTLCAIVLEGHGAQFSYGSSIQEHLPDQAADMLRRFHALVQAVLDSTVVTLAAVRGACLGGGLELAALCHRIFASPDATFGQPEIRLGVFAPIASLVLRDRVGPRAADDLCLSGRTIDAAEARDLGLVDDMADDPADAALAYARAHLVSRSASSLRLAVRAARAGLTARLAAEWPATERLYLDELMVTADASEGLRAFLEKRAPVWKHS